MKLFKNQKLARIYILFFILFYIVWIVAELVIHPALNTVIPDGSVLSQLIFDGVIKNLCWTVPALLLIRKCNADLYLKTPDMFRNPVWWKDALLVFLFEIVFCVFSALIHGGGLQTEKLSACVGYLFVGITEEFVFRGFLLNAVIDEENPYPAMALNAVLFLSIHFPIWILYGNFVNYFANLGFVTIMILSVFFSWAFLKFKNIWIPVGLHMIWDILVTLLN